MLARRFPASVRHYATRTAQKPSTNLTAASGSLKSRIIKARLANFQREQAAKSPAPEESKKLSEEEQSLQAIEKLTKHKEDMKKQGRIMPALTLPLLDLMIPYAVGARHRSAYSSVRQMAVQFADNRMNDGKNAFSMRHIGVADSFPGITVDSSLGWFRSTYLFLSRVFQAQSIKSTAWVAPMRQEFLQQYIELNQAMTRTPGDIQHLTMGPFQDEATAVMRKRPSGYKYRWTFHREVTPTRILSIRSADGNFDKEMPATGSRLAVQALVRFDTEQGVEIYDNDGKALHTPALAATPQPTRLGKALHTVPAKPQRVTEYLVLDKALYVPDAEWRFRARFTPIPGRTVAV